MKIDFTNMLAKNVGAHGLTGEQVQKMAEKIPMVHRSMNEKKAAMAWRALPYNQKEIVEDMKAEAKRINADFENFVVLGIGGSALGSKALFTGTKHLKYN